MLEFFDKDLKQVTIQNFQEKLENCLIYKSLILGKSENILRTK